jgi:hypothetical protein
MTLCQCGTFLSVYQDWPTGKLLNKCIAPFSNAGSFIGSYRHRNVKLRTVIIPG